jgi:hypothetical protein
LARARQAVDCLRNNLSVDLSAASLVISESGSVLADLGGIVDLLRGGQGVFNLVAMASIVNELDTSIDQERFVVSA